MKKSHRKTREQRTRCGAFWSESPPDLEIDPETGKKHLFFRKSQVFVDIFSKSLYTIRCVARRLIGLLRSAHRVGRRVSAVPKGAPFGQMGKQLFHQFINRTAGVWHWPKRKASVLWELEFPVERKER